MPTIGEMMKQLDRFTDEDIDALFDRIDFLLTEGKFSQIDHEISELIPAKMDLDEILAWLTITLAAKHKLPSRDKFFQQATLHSKNEPGLFDGLG